MTKAILKQPWLILVPGNCFVLSAFLEEDDSEGQSAIESDFLSAEWLQELPEDLDMCIAQRDFEGAVDLVERGLFLELSNQIWISMYVFIFIILVSGIESLSHTSVSLLCS